MASGLCKKWMWVAVSFSRSSRAAGCGVEGADPAAVGVVGLRGG